LHAPKERKKNANKNFLTNFESIFLSEWDQESLAIFQLWNFILLTNISLVKMLMYYNREIVRKIPKQWSLFPDFRSKVLEPLISADDADKQTKVSIRKHTQGLILIQEATIFVTNNFYANRESPQLSLFPFPITTFCRWISHQRIISRWLTRRIHAQSIRLRRRALTVDRQCESRNTK